MGIKGWKQMREICTYKKIKKKTAKVEDVRMNKCRNQEKKDYVANQASA